MDEEAEMAEHRRRQERLKWRAKAKGKTFVFAEHPAMVFRELCFDLQVAAHGKLSYSQLIELLVAHWRKNPPDSKWVLQFEFMTKRGRPPNKWPDFMGSG